MQASETALPLRIGARTLGTLKRRLVRRRVSLEEAIGGRLPQLPTLAADSHGYLVTAVPSTDMARLGVSAGGLAAFVRQRYRRSFARLDLGFDAYLAGFSAKSRSTLKRKTRKLAERSGGALDVRCFSRPDEIDTFHTHARKVSALTYQERLLGGGLPSGPEAIEEMRTLARRDQARGWLLFLDGRPISYLYAPAEGTSLIYAYLGYDPEYADLSPGTVLQLEAMRQLMEEKKFRLFDFTEGEGQHKRQFATDSLECVDLLLVKRNLPNLFIGCALTAFDTSVRLVKRAVIAACGEGLTRRLRR